LKDDATNGEIMSNDELQSTPMMTLSWIMMMDMKMGSTKEGEGREKRGKIKKKCKNKMFIVITI